MIKPRRYVAVPGWKAVALRVEAKKRLEKEAQLRSAAISETFYNLIIEQNRGTNNEPDTTIFVEDEGVRGMVRLDACRKDRKPLKPDELALVKRYKLPVEDRPEILAVNACFADPDWVADRLWAQEVIRKLNAFLTSANIEQCGSAAEQVLHTYPAAQRIDWRKMRDAALKLPPARALKVLPMVAQLCREADDCEDEQIAEILREAANALSPAPAKAPEQAVSPTQSLKPKATKPGKRLVPA